MKKHTPISILLGILLITFAASNYVFAQTVDYSGVGSDEKLNEAINNVNQGQNNIDLANAYATYLANPSDKNTATRLQDAYKKASIGSNNIPVESIDQVNQAMGDVIRGAMGLEANSPLPEKNSDELKATLKTLEEQQALRKTELQVIQRDRSSQKLVSESASKENVGDNTATEIANTIRNMQDIQDMQKLECFNKDESKRSSLCGDLLSQYNSRPGQEKQLTLGSNENVSDAIKSTQAKISTFESIIQNEQQLALSKQGLNVGKTLKIEGQRTFIANGQGIIYFISRIVDSLTITVTSLAVVALIIGGYMFMSSAGDEQKRENGKDVIKYTFIGLVIVFSAYAIVALIQGLLFFG
jgi:hypothetical protein